MFKWFLVVHSPLLICVGHLLPELSQDPNGNSQASATRQKMAQLEQMLSALDQLRRVRVCALLLFKQHRTTVTKNDEASASLHCS